ncbi:hypothetical protein MKW92_048130 [Papaver armeniacum]|nr:hypothetical protein MKW92_048130 [Papaver armeniacum]
MDDHLLKIYMVILSAVVLFVSLYSLKVFHAITKKQHKGITVVEPPGTTGWPIIGETLDFARANLKGIPEKFFYDRIRKYSSKVFTTSLIGDTVTVLNGTAGNKFMFSNEYKLITVCWPVAVQKIVSFTADLSSPSGVQQCKNIRQKMYPLILRRDALQKHHFDAHWDSKEEVIAYPLIQLYAFTMASRLFLSIDDDARVKDLLRIFNVVVDGYVSYPINLPGTPLNPAYIAELILVLMSAGYHTSGTVITALMKYLVEFPDVLHEVLREQQEIAKSKAPGEFLNMEDIYKMKYSWNVVCEVLRLAPPLQGGFTEALTDFTYAGYFIPKGRKLYWTGISTHMNPEYFPDPEKFDPSRFEGEGPAPYTYVPFGGGPGMCPGYGYARVQILIFVHHFVTRYKWEKLIPGNERLKVNPYPLPPKGFPIRLQSRRI